MQDLNSLEIGETPPYFSEQFCNDIEEAAESNYLNWYLPLRSDLYLYGDDNRLEIIKLKLDEIRINLEASPCKIYFSVEDMKKSLKGCLARVFELHFISEATGFDSDIFMDSGDYKMDYEKKILTVSPSISPLFEFNALDFASLNIFKPLVQYVSWCMSFHKLKELDAEIRGINISNQEKKLPEPILAALNKFQ